MTRRGARIGDEICVFMGCSCLVVWKPVEDRTHKLVGLCYVSGIMNGEALIDVSDMSNMLETIVSS